MPSNLNRTTVSLDDFDHKVITKMAETRKLSRSEVLRSIVDKWIEENEALLKNYGVDFKEIRGEILAESGVLKEEELTDVQKQIISKLKKVFITYDEISIEELANYFKVNTDVIKGIFMSHGEALKDAGLNLGIKDSNIVYQKTE